MEEYKPILSLIASENVKYCCLTCNKERDPGPSFSSTTNLICDFVNYILVSLLVKQEEKSCLIRIVEVEILEQCLPLKIILLSLTETKTNHKKPKIEGIHIVLVSDPTRAS